VSHAQLDQEAKRRIARAVASGEAVADPAEAEAAVMLARSAQRRLRARTLPNAAMISAGATIVWLVLVALPATLGSGVHLSALLAGIGVGAVLFGVILLLGQRQIRLVQQAEHRNQRVADAWAGTDDGIS
jgi:cytochrome c biogenesis protein CcdA